MARKQIRFNTPVAPAPELANRHYSAEFDWQRRDFEDRNSVYSNSHGTVGLQDKLDPRRLQDQSSVHDDSTVGTSVKFYLTSDQSVSLLPGVTESQTVQGSLSSYGDMASEVCYSDEFASENALRSNYFSQGSTRTNKLIKINFTRYRKAKNLMGRHVKGLALESIKSQLTRRDIQEIKKYSRPQTS